MKIDFSRAVIATATGGYINLSNPNPADIRLVDISKALSKLCRFSGHTSKFYSVAEHSVRVAAYLRHTGHMPLTQLAGLLHDSSEAYLGDVCTPLKNIMDEYKVLERRMEYAVERRFGVKVIGRADIKVADMTLLAYEKYHLLPHDDEQWPCLAGIDPLEYDRARPPKRNAAVLGWEPEKAEILFRKAFNRILENPLMPNNVYLLGKEAS